jgi:hypothetical protein
MGTRRLTPLSSKRLGSALWYGLAPLCYRVFLFATVLCILVDGLRAQDATFSILNDTIGIRLREVKIVDSKLTMACQYVCNSGTSSAISCARLNQFDLESGVLSGFLILDSISPEGDYRLLYSEGDFYLSGHPHGQSLMRTTSIHRLDTLLNPQSVSIINTALTGTNNNEGIIGEENYFYLYGEQVIPNNGSVPYITKVSRQTETVVWEKTYPSVHRFNQLFDMQWTPDGHLACIWKGDDGAGAGGNHKHYILKMDTAGVIVNQYVIDDYDNEPRLLSASDGAMYFTTFYEPGITFPRSPGRINRLNADFSSVDWSVPIPANFLAPGRRFLVHDYLETANGDIVACGQTTDATDGGAAAASYIVNGFIVRIAPNGEVRWLKIYKIPNPVEPITSTGAYRPSILRKVLETETGGFVAVGDVHYTLLQAQILAGVEPLDAIWILATDAEGCVEGEECAEITVLDGQYAEVPRWYIGTKWIYEEQENTTLLYGYETYEIIDTTRIEDTLAFVIEEGSTGRLDYARKDGDKVYFWNEALEQFVLHYDFANELGYNTPWTGLCQPQEATAEVSITELSYRKIIPAQCLNDQGPVADTLGTRQGNFAPQMAVGTGKMQNIHCNRCS